MQEISHHFGGVVSPSSDREFGRAILSLQEGASDLFSGVSSGDQMWMSHGDKVTKLPEGFHTIASTCNSDNAAIAHHINHIYGLQFHPEVLYT